MVKKNWFKVLPALVGGVLAAVMLSGCAGMIKSMTKVWDETLPDSEMASLVFLPSKVTTYNGVVMEEPYFFLKIPGGAADLTINMVILNGNSRYQADGMEFEFSFEAGKEYQMRAGFRDPAEPDVAYWGEGKGRLCGVYIYDYYAKVGYPSADHLVAFVPFKYQPEFSSWTVF